MASPHKIYKYYSIGNNPLTRDEKGVTQKVTLFVMV
jgi:hypothetical protein